MVADGVRWLCGFGVAMTVAETASLAHRARRIGFAIVSFTAGAIAGGLEQAHIGYPGLLAPILALLMLIPFGRAEIRATARELN